MSDMKRYELIFSVGDLNSKSVLYVKNLEDGGVHASIGLEAIDIYERIKKIMEDKNEH